MICIKGLPKDMLLMTLFNHSHQQGMGCLDPLGGHPMTIATAASDVAKSSPHLYFDYVHGRVLKVDLSGDYLDDRLYDRDNYQGATRDAILDRRWRVDLDEFERYHAA